MAACDRGAFKCIPPGS